MNSLLRSGSTFVRILRNNSLRSPSVPASSSVFQSISRGFAKRDLSSSLLKRASDYARHMKSSARPIGNSRYINSRERFCVVSIIGLNTLIFCTWKVSTDTSLAINHGSRIFNRWLNRFMTDNFMISSNGVLRDFKLHTLITSFFSHMDFSHYAMNMFTLYFFGLNAVNYLGVARFVMLYFGGGVLSSAAVVAWPYIGEYFGDRFRGSSNKKDFMGLGASGAISALIGWSVLTNPSAIIYLWAVLPVPAALFGAYYIGSGLYNLYEHNDTAEVSHLGGASFGILYFLRMQLSRGPRF